jgi:hypothetical protein
MKNPIRKFSPVVRDAYAGPSVAYVDDSPDPVQRGGDERRARRRETAAVSAFVLGLSEGRPAARSAA